jgi:antitoxin MazE
MGVYIVYTIKVKVRGFAVKIQTTIQKWGNSLAIRITGPLRTIPHFSANMPVEIEVSESGLTIHPLTLKKRKLLLFTEAQLLEGLTPKKAHADEIADIHDQEFEGHE